MTFKAPKAIKDHPGVEECVSGEAGGAPKKYDVWMKDGWHFLGLDGFDEPCDATRRQGFFNTVAEFKDALPHKF